MPSPPITLYMTTIASQPALRQRQEYIFRILHVKKIPFNTYDLASDEEAKRLWRRRAPADKQQLPGILVGGKFPGTFAEFEDAVEHDELDIFLRLNESWNPDIDEDRPPPPVKPVGIPGASTPLQMTPEHLRAKHFGNLTPAASPLRTKLVPVNKRTGELDMGDELGGFGLQGVKVTNDELADLIAQLGLEGDEAGDLMQGLSDPTAAPAKAPKAVKEEPKVDEPKAPIEQPKVVAEPEVLVEKPKSEEPKAVEEEPKEDVDKPKVADEAKVLSTEETAPADIPESSPSAEVVEEQHKEPISQ
ncbi:hypothetical protein HYPSUDRAFT_32699 [Hypholoma sublateritium FD-334 SS-4]|uniref:SH3 domain-binding glutamic acid-rich protein n=1 Tax=Hypholoma sublateritium (strain FD-334 SS-4) TaxID=945553 RepID=A0A0D2LMP2_HYPSF|nr:hypothetical protein HYPSUDRAFT_32699 [Hypholoma sublateritium FD-334 SS-4]